MILIVYQRFRQGFSRVEVPSAGALDGGVLLLVFRRSVASMKSLNWWLNYCFFILLFSYSFVLSFG